MVLSDLVKSDTRVMVLFIPVHPCLKSTFCLFLSFFVHSNWTWVTKRFCVDRLKPLDIAHVPCSAMTGEAV